MCFIGNFILVKWNVVPNFTNANKKMRHNLHIFTQFATFALHYNIFNWQIT